MFDTATLKKLEGLAIEVPSWAYGNSGTRFKVFATPGTPRTIQEKLQDAAQVHAHTGLAPSVALHIPWDRVDDYPALTAYAADLGLTLGTINSNTFQDDDYKLGSLTHSDPHIRQKAIDHHVDCIDVMDATGSRDLKIWLPDGTNYAGQADLRGRQDRLADSLQQIYARLGENQRLVLEYKIFEPYFYSMDVPDWGTAYAHVAALGERATVCLDTGHHAPSTNIEFIVTQLLRLGKLGSFDFNSRYYADDDLIVGSAHPFQLFRILFEVVRGGGLEPETGVALMLDQCHNIEDKIPGQIRSVLNVQETVAKVLLVDREALAAAQDAGDVLAANAIFMDAFWTDVRPALADWREERGLPGTPARLSSPPATSTASLPSASAGSRRAGAPDSPTPYGAGVGAARPAVEARTTSSGWSTGWRSTTSSPARMRSTAMVPRSWRGWRTLVNGTAAMDANSMSSYPTIARSSGTASPRRLASCSTPSASMSLAQKTAVGRSSAGSSRIRAAALRPSCAESQSVSTTTSASSGSPASPSAASAPAWRPVTWAMLPGVPTKAIRRCPSSIRWATAARPPATSSTPTLGMGESGGSMWSTSTIGSPRPGSSRSRGLV